MRSGAWGVVVYELNNAVRVEVERGMRRNEEGREGGRMSFLHRTPPFLYTQRGDRRAQKMVRCGF